MTKIFCGDALDIVPELPYPDLIYIDPPFFTQRDFESFDDRWASLQTYTDWLTGYCSVGWDALNPGGNFLIHLDWHAVHAMKVRLDHCFGGNFVNEIIWSYNSGGASKRRLSRKHDNILWYTKPGAEYTFNVIREPYATPDAADRPGFHPDGRMLTDVWQIPFLSTTAKERTGYPTQKPLALLERIITIFSNEGDLVLDYFCGSGTTGVAAEKLARRSILVDSSPEATSIAQARLEMLKSEATPDAGVAGA